MHGSPRFLNEDLPENTPDDALDVIFQPIKADILCIGHTHLPYYRIFKGHWIVNAGSIGRPLHGDPDAVYCLITVGDQLHIEFPKVSYNTNAMAKSILDAGLPATFVKRICTGKD